MSMNRQLRRAQDKQDKKVEKAKQDRRDERQKRLARLRKERDQRRVAATASYNAGKDGKGPGKTAGTTATPPARTGRDPGRFTAVLAAATTFFILLQIFVPTPPQSTLDSVVKAGFYLMFGYFVMLFLLRRNNPNAFPITLGTGFVLLAATFFADFSRSAGSLDTLSLALAIPLLLGGVWLGRLVYNQAPG